MEQLRNRILHGCGTDEPWYLEDPVAFTLDTGKTMVAGNWRKPLRVDEVNQMAPTSEVRARPGRP